MISIQLHKKLHGTNGEFSLQINEQIKDYELLGVYGKSGVGKTTLLRMLSGLDTPDSGSIVVNDEVWFDASLNINVTPQKRAVGYVFQEDVLFPNMTVLENLKFALKKGISNSLLEELIAIMELDQLLDVFPNKLSGGQKQRVSLARTLVQQPKLLLLDEPLSALDFELRIKLREYIEKVHEVYKLTTLLVSHDPLELLQLATHIWSIEGGNIITQGIPKEVLPIAKLLEQFKGVNNKIQ